jgi:hypothetical protein
MVSIAGNSTLFRGSAQSELRGTHQMVKRKFELGLSNGFCTMGGAISGEKKELSCQVTRNMGKLPNSAY